MKTLAALGWYEIRTYPTTSPTHNVNTHTPTPPHTEQTFTVGCAPETIRRTNLGSLQEGALVNLERCVYLVLL